MFVGRNACDGGAGSASMTDSGLDESNEASSWRGLQSGRMRLAPGPYLSNSWFNPCFGREKKNCMCIRGQLLSLGTVHAMPDLSWILVQIN